MEKKREKKQVYTLYETARILGIDARTVVAHNLLPIKKVGRRWTINRADIASYIGTNDF